jgi:hypothetical protein
MLAVRIRAIDGKGLSPSRFAALPAATGTSPLQGTHRLVQLRQPSGKRRQKRLLHHCLREISRTRKVEVCSAIRKLDSFAPYFVQSRTLGRGRFPPAGRRRNEYFGLDDGRVTFVAHYKRLAQPAAGVDRPSIIVRTDDRWASPPSLGMAPAFISSRRSVLFRRGWGLGQGGITPEPPCPPWSRHQLE